MKKNKKLEDILKSVMVGTSFGSVFPLMGYFGRHSNNMDVSSGVLTGLYCLGLTTAINVGTNYFKNNLNQTKNEELGLTRQTYSDNQNAQDY